MDISHQIFNDGIFTRKQAQRSRIKAFMKIVEALLDAKTVCTWEYVSESVEFTSISYSLMRIQALKLPLKCRKIQTI